MSCATVAEVLKQYGYTTGAFGKWHNTPAEQTTAAGPFNYWPTGYGFEYFYGMLAGEASQYEPCLVRNTTLVDHPRTSAGTTTTSPKTWPTTASAGCAGTRRSSRTSPS